MKKIRLKLLIPVMMAMLLCWGTAGCSDGPKVSGQDYSDVSVISMETPDEGLLIIDAEKPEESAVPAVQEEPEEPVEEAAEPYLDPDGAYTSKDDVALYLYLYGELPQNFITKEEARELGWIGGSLEPYAPGKCIGGDYFGNFEGLLPRKKGLTYHECDIDTLGKKNRGAKRIIYGTDGSIYYTEDHFETFEELYGGDG